MIAAGTSHRPAVPAVAARADIPAPALSEPEPAVSPPRVLAVLPCVAEGPSFIFSKRQVRALQEMGVPVETFYVESRRSLPELARSWWRFRRVVRAFDPDVVHAHFGTMLSFFCAVSSGRPLVITFRGSDLNPVPSISRTRSAAGKLLSQLSAARAARIICVSEQLRQRLWWRAGRATVIPNGVDTREFFPRPRAEARRALGWDAGERVVLFNGGTLPRKKRLDLAEAAVEVANRLAGPVRLEVLDGNVDGSRVPLYMSASDCLIVTSDWEGSPDIVKEAMACDLPIVSVDVGDVAERLERVRPTRMSERDPEALGRALVEVLACGTRSNGSVVVQELTMERVAGRVLAELQAAVRRRRA